MSQAPVVVCAFNDAGNVRHNAAAKAVEFHHSNDRLKRGKRIAGYFGLGFRNVSQQCAFARVGVAYQPGVRNAAQFHEEDSFLPLRSHLGFRRRLVGRGTEMPVSLAAEAALAQREPGADFRQIRYFFQFNAFTFPFQPGRLRHGRGIAAVDNGAGGHFPDDGFAVLAMFLGALSAYPIRGD